MTYEEAKAAMEAETLIEGGTPYTEDYDTGKVFDLRDDQADVAWQSGVRTWTPLEDLRICDEPKFEK